MSEQNALPDLELHLYSQARLLASARALTSSFAARIGFDEIQCGQISLAVDEALCNVINHGYERDERGRITVTIWGLKATEGGTGPGLKIVIEDRAKQVDPASIRSRDLDDIRPGGLGVHIIREIMDHVEYEKREGGGMRLRMVKYVPAVAPQKAPGRTTACESEGKHDTRR